jgi:hypothetical protein
VVVASCEADVFKTQLEISVLTEKKKHFSYIEIIWVTLFTEVIALYFMKYTKLGSMLCGQNGQTLIVKGNGAYR